MILAILLGKIIIYKRELCTLADYLTLNLVSGTRTSKLYNEIISNNLTLI
jgi:hypothetical protein